MFVSFFMINISTQIYPFPTNIRCDIMFFTTNTAKYANGIAAKTSMLKCTRWIINETPTIIVKIKKISFFPDNKNIEKINAV